MAQTECLKPGCTNVAKKKGVCLQHYAENYVGACTVAGCTNPLQAKGRCKLHYNRYLRKKNGESAPDQEEPARQYARDVQVVYTRIPRDAYEVIRAKAHEPGGGIYRKVQEILTEWAEQHAA